MGLMGYGVEPPETSEEERLRLLKLQEAQGLMGANYDDGAPPDYSGGNTDAPVTPEAAPQEEPNKGKMQTSSTTEKPVDYATYASYAITAAQIASLFLSDPETKKNVELVGTRPDGLNEYEWEYKKKYQNDPFAGEGRMRGLMANEVEKLYPEAVVRHPTKDVKMINYGLLSRGM